MQVQWGKADSINTLGANTVYSNMTSRHSISRFVELAQVSYSTVTLFDILFRRDKCHLDALHSKEMEL